MTMIRDTFRSETRNPDGTIELSAHKETSVILHCYTLSKNDKTKTWNYSEDTNPNPNDGKRHRIRSFVIAHDNNPYPDATKLKTLINIPTKSHSNIKTSSDYGTKLGGFCLTCLSMVKKECKTKFGGNW